MGLKAALAAANWRDKAVSAEDAAALLPSVPRADRGPYVQLWGDVHGTDAMFLALLRRSAAAAPT